VLGVFISFFTIGKFVFSNTDNWRIFRFVGVYVVVYLVNISGLWVFDDFGVDLYLAGALLILPLAMVSFV